MEEINRKAAEAASRWEKVSQQPERGLKPKANEILRIIEGEGADKVASLKEFFLSHYPQKT